MVGGDGRTEHRMYFTDKKYSDWMQLCGRPECSHRTYDCNAYIGEDPGGSEIWLYGDHFYFFLSNEDEEPELWRMKLDGTEHEKLMACSTEELNTFNWFFHNKYVFLTFVSNVPETAEIKRELFCIDLSSSELKPIKYDITDENGNPQSFAWS